MAAHFRQILPVDCAKQITMPVRNGFVEGGGEREVRRLPPILSAVIPIGNTKKANKSPGNSPRAKFGPILSAVITLVTGEAKGREMTAERAGPSCAGELPGTLVVSGYLLS